MIRKAKKMLEAELAKDIKTDPKAYYNYTKSKMGVSKSVGPLEDENDDMASDDEKMAEILNECLSTVFTEELVTDITNPSRVDTREQMS